MTDPLCPNCGGRPFGGAGDWGLLALRASDGEDLATLGRARARGNLICAYPGDGCDEQVAALTEPVPGSVLSPGTIVHRRCGAPLLGGRVTAWVPGCGRPSPLMAVRLCAGHAALRDAGPGGGWVLAESGQRVLDLLACREVLGP